MGAVRSGWVCGRPAGTFSQPCWSAGVEQYGLAVAVESLVLFQCSRRFCLLLTTLPVVLEYQLCGSSLSPISLRCLLRQYCARLSKSASLVEGFTTQLFRCWRIDLSVINLLWPARDIFKSAPPGKLGKGGGDMLGSARGEFSNCLIRVWRRCQTRLGAVARFHTGNIER